MLKNFFRKKVEKKIPDNTYRVIKISKDALFEYIYESFNDALEDFLDITDISSVVNAYGMSYDEGSFILVSRNAKSDLDLYEEIDVEKILNAIPDTTSTMYSECRYIDLTAEQVEEIQKK